MMRRLFCREKFEEDIFHVTSLAASLVIMYYGCLRNPGPGGMNGNAKDHRRGSPRCRTLSIILFARLTGFPVRSYNAFVLRTKGHLFQLVQFPTLTLHLNFQFGIGGLKR